MTTAKTTQSDLAKIAADKDLHPGDRRDQVSSVREAAERIDDWFARHADEFKALVQTYADGDAEALFESLRERFWTGEP